MCALLFKNENNPKLFCIMFVIIQQKYSVSRNNFLYAKNFENEMNAYIDYVFV